MSLRLNLAPVQCHTLPYIFAVRSKGSREYDQRASLICSSRVLNISPLQLLAEGKSMKEAGGILGITARTIAFHKYSMMESLGINRNPNLLSL